MSLLAKERREVTGIARIARSPRLAEDLSFVVMQKSLLAKDREEVTVIASEGVSERVEDLPFLVM